MYNSLLSLKALFLFIMHKDIQVYETSNYNRSMWYYYPFRTTNGYNHHCYNIKLSLSISIPYNVTTLISRLVPCICAKSTGNKPLQQQCCFVLIYFIRNSTDVSELSSGTYILYYFKFSVN
jgi:hypothetical protein